MSKATDTQEELLENEESEREHDDIINEMLQALANNHDALHSWAVINDDANASNEDDELEVHAEEDFPANWNHNHLFDQLARIRQLVNSQQFELITSDSDDEDSERFSEVLETLQSQGKLIQGSSTNRLDHFETDPIYYSNCSVSTRHFQLRHQIWCHVPPSEAALKAYFAATQNEESPEISPHSNPELLSQFDDYVYFVYNWYIMQLNHKTGTTSIVKSLTYYPQAMHAAYGFIACCGSNGQMTVINLFDNNIIFQGEDVSNGTLNNCVHISFFSNKLHVMCCSNNSTIRVWELMDSSVNDVGSIVEEDPINYCQVSPDGKKLVAAGDSADIILSTLCTRDAENQAIIDSKKVLSFPDGMGDGFSVSWDSTSTLFAVARLNPGLICVWNADTLDLVYVIKPTTSDATCLSVKFFEPEDGMYAQQVPPPNRFTEEAMLTPKKRAQMLLFTQRDLTAHLVHLSKKTEQTFSPLTHANLKEHMKREAEQEDDKPTLNVPLPAESDVRPIPKSFTRNCYSFSPRIGGATYSNDYSKIFIGFENFIAEYRVRGVRSLLDYCVRFLRKHPDVWRNSRDLLPMDLLDKLEADDENPLHM